MSKRDNKRVFQAIKELKTMGMGASAVADMLEMLRDQVAAGANEASIPIPIPRDMIRCGEVVPSFGSLDSRDIGDIVHHASVAVRLAIPSGIHFVLALHGLDWPAVAIRTDEPDDAWIKIAGHSVTLAGSDADQNHARCDCGQCALYRENIDRAWRDRPRAVAPEHYKMQVSRSAKIVVPIFTEDGNVH